MRNPKLTWANIRREFGIFYDDCLLCLSFFTVIPVRVSDVPAAASRRDTGVVATEPVGEAQESSEILDPPFVETEPTRSLAQAMRAVAVIGLCVGAVGALLLVAAMMGGLPGFAAGLIAVLAMILVTGALHEDGLADSADSFGGRSPHRRLAIMRDSRVGSFGALALVFSVTLRASCIGAVAVHLGATEAALLLVSGAILSRLVPLCLLFFLRPAQQNGAAHHAGRPERRDVLQGVGLGVGLAALMSVPLIGWTGLIPLLILLALTAAVVGALARAYHGGQSGDIAGAGQQIGEIMFWIGLAVVVL